MRAALLPLLLLIAAAPTPTGLHDFAVAERAAGLPRSFGRPVTVFAPTDAAFAALPEGIHQRLLRSENRAALARVLGYHMVEGAWTAAALRRRIADAGGTVRLDTIEGEPLMLRLSLGVLELSDANGNTARVVGGERRGADGPVYRLDHVMIPRMDRD